MEARSLELDDAVVAHGLQVLAGLDLWAGISGTSRSVLLAAVESFGVRGFHGTNLRHIAEGSGRSTAALYVHFRSKEELLFEISLRGHTVARDLVEAVVALSLPPSDGLCCFVYAFTRWHAEHRTTARVVQYEQAALSAEHARVIADIGHRTEHGVRTLIALGAETGVFDALDVRGAAAAVLSLGIDVARWYRSGVPYDPDRLSRLYAALALRMLGGGPASQRDPG